MTLDDVVNAEHWATAMFQPEEGEIRNTCIAFLEGCGVQDAATAVITPFESPWAWVATQQGNKRFLTAFEMQSMGMPEPTVTVWDYLGLVEGVSLIEPLNECSLWTSIHVNLLEIKGAFCHGCGTDYRFDERVLEVEPIKPRSQVGPDDFYESLEVLYEALTLLCPPCNRVKRHRDISLAELQEANRADVASLRGNGYAPTGRWQ